jgi:hypothetical protein
MASSSAFGPSRSILSTHRKTRKRTAAHADPILARRHRRWSRGKSCSCTPQATTCGGPTSPTRPGTRRSKPSAGQLSSVSCASKPVATGKKRRHLEFTDQAIERHLIADRYRDERPVALDDHWPLRQRGSTRPRWLGGRQGRSRTTPATSYRRGSPEAFHDTTKHANNRYEADRGRLKPGCGRCGASKPTRRPR